VRRALRPAMIGAIVASIALHALALAAFITVSSDRQEALVAPAVPEQPAIEVDILADPRAGAPEQDAATEAQPVPPPEETPTEAPAEQAATPTEAAEPTPAPLEQVETAPPPPSPPAPPTPPPRAAATAPALRLPPPRLRAGSATEGRPDGTTDIILSERSVPPGPDPSRYNMPPRYPQEAARRGQQGMVVLSVTVATDGTALSVQVAESSGYPLLDRAAQDAVTKWHFRAGQEGGITMPANIPVRLSFILENR